MFECNNLCLHLNLSWLVSFVWDWDFPVNELIYRCWPVQLVSVWSGVARLWWVALFHVPVSSMVHCHISEVECAGGTETKANQSDDDRGVVQQCVDNERWWDDNVEHKPCTHSHCHTHQCTGHTPSHTHVHTATLHQHALQCRRALIEPTDNLAGDVLGRVGRDGVVWTQVGVERCRRGLRQVMEWISHLQDTQTHAPSCQYLFKHRRTNVNAARSWCRCRTQTERCRLGLRGKWWRE